MVSLTFSQPSVIRPNSSQILNRRNYRLFSFVFFSQHFLFSSISSLHFNIYLTFSKKRKKILPEFVFVDNKRESLFSKPHFYWRQTMIQKAQKRVKKTWLFFSFFLLNFFLLFFRKINLWIRLQTKQQQQ